jgi:hypothetical protein
LRDLTQLNHYRVQLPPSIAALWRVPDMGNAICGAFVVRSRIEPKALRILASNGDGWDHVSVSLVSRCPRWAEMEQVKRMFFLPDEVAMQLHVPASDHISVHPYCLHLWRPHEGAIPLPPPAMVA